MAKYKFYASLGYTNAKREEDVDIPDEELEGLSEEEREKYIQEEYDNWLGNTGDFGFYKIEEEGAGE